MNDQHALETEYTEIVNKYIDELYNYARYLTSDKEEASDIIQTTFLALYKNFNKLDRSKPVRAWLYRVTRNNCFDHLKKKKALNFSELENENLDIPEIDSDLEAQISSEIFQEQVRHIFETLAIPVKEVMILKYFEDFTFEDIAEHMEIPINTVKSHFYRGKSKVYQLLKQQVYAQ